METDFTSEKWLCYILFIKFSKEVRLLIQSEVFFYNECFFQVLIRMKQFKDDILCSCLEFILELPVEIVSNDNHLFVPAIQARKLLKIFCHR